jgi:putative aminopeptidase FrvX
LKKKEQILDYSLLKAMCAIQATPGFENNMKVFLLDYLKKDKKKFKHRFKILEGKDFQDAVILIFGKPKTAIFSHMDNIGFTVRYGNQLIKAGGPVTKDGMKLVGEDKLGKIECKLRVDSEKKLTYEFTREIERGTPLSFKPDWRETKDTIQCSYMDNRLGIYNALKVAETMKDGIICFTCWEEVGGGSAQVCGKYIYEKYKVQQAIISDITWATDGVKLGKGVAISMRDTALPRRSYVNKVIAIAKQHKIEHQIEVENAGGSDGNALQSSPYPIDWCFIGVPEENVHSPNEKVNKTDIENMIALYKALMMEL